MINIPNDLTAQKRFRRIVDIMIDSVDDDISDLAEHLLAENDAPAAPDPNDNLAYDAWCEEHLRPVQNRIYTLIAEFMTD